MLMGVVLLSVGECVYWCRPDRRAWRLGWCLQHAAKFGLHMSLTHTHTAVSAACLPLLPHAFNSNTPKQTQADIANDNKAAQLDDNVNTLLGLDANRLCRWDMRDRRGVVQVRSRSGCIWGRGEGMWETHLGLCFARHYV